MGAEVDNNNISENNTFSNDIGTISNDIENANYTSSFDAPDDSFGVNSDTVVGANNSIKYQTPKTLNLNTRRISADVSSKSRHSFSTGNQTASRKYSHGSASGFQHLYARNVADAVALMSGSDATHSFNSTGNTYTGKIGASFSVQGSSKSSTRQTPSKQYKYIQQQQLSQKAPLHLQTDKNSPQLTPPLTLDTQQSDGDVVAFLTLKPHNSRRRSLNIRQSVTNIYQTSSNLFRPSDTGTKRWSPHGLTSEQVEFGGVNEDFTEEMLDFLKHQSPELYQLMQQANSSNNSNRTSSERNPNNNSSGRNTTDSALDSTRNDIENNMENNGVTTGALSVENNLEPHSAGTLSTKETWFTPQYATSLTPQPNGDRTPIRSAYFHAVNTLYPLQENSHNSQYLSQNNSADHSSSHICTTDIATLPVTNISMIMKAAYMFRSRVSPHKNKIAAAPTSLHRSDTGLASLATVTTNTSLPLTLKQPTEC